jgi:hypothetical protein
MRLGNRHTDTLDRILSRVPSAVLTIVTEVRLDVDMALEVAESGNLAHRDRAGEHEEHMRVHGKVSVVLERPHSKERFMASRSSSTR